MQKLIAILALASLAACAETTGAVNSDATPAKLQESTAQFFAISCDPARNGPRDSRSVWNY